MNISKDKERLFNEVLTVFGAPVRSVELTTDMLCNLLNIATGEYAQYVQSFIIESNWAQIYGKQYGSLSNQEMAHVLSFKDLDFSKQVSYIFSKDVGLQQRGPWELKKDFFHLESGRQVYQVPANREINRVMWVTPPVTDAATWANYGGMSATFGGGVMGQMGMGAASVFGGMGGSYNMGVGLWALPASDVWYMSADLKQKNQLFRGDLVYKVTAGPDGTHLIHLESTPGSKFTLSMSQNSLAGCTCWYTYYDTSIGDEDECRIQNASDIVLTPDQVPLAEMEWEQMNYPTQSLIRQLFIGYCAESLAMVRGKFSGNINMINSQLTMDYNLLINYGQKEKDLARQNLKERLDRLTPWYQMERNAKMVEDNRTILKQTPLKIYRK